MRFFILMFIVFFSCTDRQSNINEPVVADEPTQVLYTKSIKPDNVNINYSADDPIFKDAIFSDIEANDVWAVHHIVDNDTVRLSWELNFDDPFPYMLHTDKFTDNSGNRHIAVYCVLPKNDNVDMNNIILTVGIDGKDPSKSDEFSVISPSEFGQIKETIHGPFREAVFNGYNAIDVWAVYKIYQNGQRGKVSLARRFNKPLFVYLRETQFINSDGKYIPQVRVGLPVKPGLPLESIEIIVTK